MGEAYNYQGNNYNGTTLDLVGGTVVNDGTVLLVAQGSASKSGGPATVAGGTIRNNGKILAVVQDPSWTVQYQAGLVNTRKGTLSVTGGMFNDDGSFPVTNDGTVTIAARALYQLESAAAFTNEKDGKIVTQIASAKSLGQFLLVSPCCAGPGKFTAGGSLAPQLAGRYAAGRQHRVPAVPAFRRELHRRFRPPPQELHGRLRPRDGDPGFRWCRLRQVEPRKRSSEPNSEP